MNCCYTGYINEFLTISYDKWIDEMCLKYSTLCNEGPSDQQVEAWRDCYYKITPILSQSSNQGYYLVFEYELPREGGRRPDLILLSDRNIIVLEFKQKATITQADVDQVAAYARDIKNYHKESHDLEVFPVLLVTKGLVKAKYYGEVLACSPDKLLENINTLLGSTPVVDPQIWIGSDYEPLPTLVNAAKMIYRHEPLPYIRRANSAGIPEAVQALSTIANQAVLNQERVLALVTGVPGSGKTLLGLKFVYECFSNDNNKKSVFLSGNGPLVEVLQHALKSKVFVQSLRNFIKHYGVEKRGVPTERIVVFDEAQRAWDLDHVSEKHSINKSEPDLIIEIADSMPEWAMFLGLVGEGQEIHNGEEAGMVQWRDAIIKSHHNWKVVCPSKIAGIFEDVAKVVKIDKLDLNVTLRSHLAEDVTSWANAVLTADIDTAKHLGEIINNQGFKMYVTQDLEKAKRYCYSRYSDSEEKRYGLIASSKAKILPQWGVDNDYNNTKALKVGPWYNDEPDSILSCCNMNKVATEFACQGLELDMPIICWGEDLSWANGNWKHFEQKRSQAHDPHQLRVNSYRVLLTRGRDGFIVFAPPVKALNNTYDALIEFGIHAL